MCIVHDIEDYLPDGGQSFLGDPDAVRDLEETKRKIALSQERLRKAHAYSTQNVAVACPYDKNALHTHSDNNPPPAGQQPPPEHPPHAAPCGKCGLIAGKATYHALARDDLAKEVARKYLEKINAGDPIKTAMTAAGSPAKMVGVIVCVEPASGRLKVIKAHSGPGLGPDFADLDCYAPFLPRETADEQALAQTRAALATLPGETATGKAAVKAARKAASAAENAVAKLVADAFAPSAGADAQQAKQELRQAKKAAKAAAPAGSLAPDPADDAATAALKAARLENEAAQAALKAVEDGAAERKRLEKLAEAQSRKFRVGTFRDDATTDISQICVKPDRSPETVKGNCGVCAAPKLLMAARAAGLAPVSMAEFWVGQERDGWTEGAFIDSCGECMTIVGTMMCGIDERNVALAPTLDAKIA